MPSPRPVAFGDERRARRTSASIEFSRRLHDGEFDACFVQPSRGQD